MDKILNQYLDKVDRYLRPMSAADRADIINEIKSEMAELEAGKSCTPEQIMERLGDPKEMARAYLGEAIVKTGRFRIRKLAAMAAFYGVAGLGGMFILPFTSILGAALMLSGLLAPLAGLVKAAGFLLGLDVPVVVFQFGSFTAHPLLALPLSVIMGVLFFLVGKGLWRITLGYVRMVAKGRGK